MQGLRKTIKIGVLALLALSSACTRLTSTPADAGTPERSVYDSIAADSTHDLGDGSVDARVDSRPPLDLSVDSASSPDTSVDSGDDYAQLFTMRTTSTSPATFDVSVVKSGTVLRWDLGDGTVSHQLSVSHTYTVAGEKIVSVYSVDGVAGLTELTASNDALLGTLLSDLTSLTGLRRLDLRDNQLSGSIPFGIDKLINLEELRLDRNEIRFSLPGALNKLTRLRIVTLSDNSVSNYASGALSGLLSLEEVDVSNNSLSDSAIDLLVGDLYLDRASHTAPAKFLWLDGAGNGTPGTTALTQIGELGASWGWTIIHNGGA